MKFKDLTITIEHKIKYLIVRNFIIYLINEREKTNIFKKKDIINSLTRHLAHFGPHHYKSDSVEERYGPVKFEEGKRKAKTIICREFPELIEESNSFIFING